MSLRAAGFQVVFRLVGSLTRLRKPTALRLRKSMEDGVRILSKPVKGVTLEDIEMGGIPGVRFTPSEVSDPTVMVFLHGGGYISCSARLYAGLISKLAQATGMVVLAPDYRLAPEHPMPAGREDCLAAYRSVEAERIVLGGDSAGGGLTLSTLQALTPEEMPAAAFTISAHADHTGSGESWTTRRRADPMMSGKELHVLAAAVCGDLPRDDPRVSPLFGDFSGLPPLLMMVGDREMLLSDSVRCVEKAKAAGVDATLQVAPKMHHDWPMFPIPEARPALAMIAAHVQ